MKIDFHVHTNASPCSNTSLKDAVKAAIDKGLSGIAVCNHNKPFLESDIPRELEEAFKIKFNPDTPCNNAFYIIPGIEISTDGGHFLGLFIESKISELSEIASAKGITVYAHPFEQNSDYNKRSLEMNDQKFDLIETHSGRASYKNKRAIEQAIRYAEESKINKCAGSDAHFTYEIGNACVEFSDDVVGLSGIKEALLSENLKYHCRSSKRVDIAKSQIVKHGYTFKTMAFYTYSFIRDLGDNLCQKSH